MAQDGAKIATVSDATEVAYARGIKGEQDRIFMVLVVDVPIDI